MHTHVRTQVTTLREAFATHTTVAVTDCSVRPHVTAECRTWLETCRTSLTHNWLLSCVHALVQIPQMVVSKPFAARRAAIRPFLSMHSHVVTQQRALDKAPSANRTDVWPSIGVDALMNIEGAVLGKLAATHAARIRTLSCVTTDVDLQGALVTETFATCQAHMRRRATSVHLQVLPIVFKLYEPTPAHSTAVRSCLLFLSHRDTCPNAVMALELLCRWVLLLADSAWEGLAFGRACQIEYAVHFWQYSNNINFRHFVFATSLCLLHQTYSSCFQYY